MEPSYITIDYDRINSMNWLLLRGFGREKRYWGSFPDQFEIELKKKYPKAKIMTIDLPGFGTEFLRKSPSNIPEIVKDVRDRWLAERGEGSGEWNMLAVSLGGMIALSWAEDYPNDFKRMVLVNSSLKGLSPATKRVMPRNYFTLLRIIFSNNFLTREKMVLKMITSLKGGALLELARENATYAKMSPPRRRNAFAQIFAIMKFKPSIKTSVPKLILSSLGDTFTDPKCSEDLAHYYQAPHKKHPNANHDLPTDDGAWVINQVIEWL
jgi:pimeloyl-ACP methyl ester carboxylesterase